MEKILSLLGILVVLVLIGISAFMNYEFLSSWGTNFKSSVLLGGLSVALDFLKALLIFYILWAIANKKLLFVGISSSIFGGLMILSLASGMGFIAKQRDQVANDKSAVTSTLETIKTKLLMEKQKLQNLPVARARGIIEQEIKAARLHRRYASSKSCTNATAHKSKVFCTAYFKLLAEAESARERHDIETNISQLEAQKNTLIIRGGESKNKNDAQTSLIVKITGQNADLVQTSINFFIAVLVEMATAFGLYMATGHGGRAQSQKVVPAASANSVVSFPVQTEQKPAIQKREHSVGKSKKIAKSTLKKQNDKKKPQPKRAVISENLSKIRADNDEELTPIAALLQQNFEIVATNKG